MVDGIVIQSLSSSPSFFASTTILIIGGLLAVLGTTEKASELVREIPFAARTSVLVFDLKIVLLLGIFVYAFFRFTWSLRQYTFGALLVGALPERDDLLAMGDAAAPIREASAERAGPCVVGLAAETFNDGLRAYYFAFAAIGWFFRRWPRGRHRGRRLHPLPARVPPEVLKVLSRPPVTCDRAGRAGAKARPPRGQSRGPAAARADAASQAASPNSFHSVRSLHPARQRRRAGLRSARQKRRADPRHCAARRHHQVAPTGQRGPRLPRPSIGGLRTGGMPRLVQQGRGVARGAPMRAPRAARFRLPSACDKSTSRAPVPHPRKPLPQNAAHGLHPPAQPHEFSVVDGTLRVDDMVVGGQGRAGRAGDHRPVEPVRRGEVLQPGTQERRQAHPRRRRLARRATAARAGQPPAAAGAKPRGLPQPPARSSPRPGSPTSSAASLGEVGVAGRAWRGADRARAPDLGAVGRRCWWATRRVPRPRPGASRPVPSAGLELQRGGMPAHEAQVRAAVPLAAELGLPVVANDPIQFLTPEDFQATGAHLRRRGRDAHQPQRIKPRQPQQHWFKTRARMAKSSPTFPRRSPTRVQIAQPLQPRQAAGQAAAGTSDAEGVTVDQRGRCRCRDAAASCRTRAGGAAHLPMRRSTEKRPLRRERLDF